MPEQSASHTDGKPILQIHIATGQTLANLIPVLVEQPDQILVLHTRDMETSAHRFRTIFRACGYADDQIHARPLPGTDFEALYDDAHNLILELIERYPEHEIVYNTTGGTKIMSLAWHEALRQENYRIVYADTQNQRWVTLNPVKRSDPMPTVLNVRTQLQGTGRRPLKIASEEPEWQARTRQRKRLTKALAQASRLDNPPWGILNMLAGEARDKNGGLVEPLQTWTNGKLPKPVREILEQASAEGLVRFDGSHQTVEFLTADASAYLGGSWLEEYVWLEASTLGLDEVACGVEFDDFNQKKKDLRNEVDLMVMHRNLLLIVECKTGGYQSEQPVNDIIYKLDSIAGLAGGHLSRRLLVSGRPLTHTTRSGRTVYHGERGHSMNIDTLEKAELLTFRAYVKEWAGLE